MRSIIIVLPIMLVVLCVPILIGVYVYRDAERRGMNGLLWALVAAFVPSLIGLIIYLLVRGNYSDLKCPRCSAPVKEEYTVCPGCGAKLRSSCPNCSAPVEPNWKVCPRCAQPLSEVENDVMPPVRSRDRTLGKVLLVIILIPALLIALAIFGLTAKISGGRPASLGQISRSAALKAEYKPLSEEKDKLYSEYGELKKQLREYIFLALNV